MNEDRDTARAVEARDRAQADGTASLDALDAEMDRLDAELDRLIHDAMPGEGPQAEVAWRHFQEQTLPDKSGFLRLSAALRWTGRQTHRLLSRPRRRLPRDTRRRSVWL